MDKEILWLVPYRDEDLICDDSELLDKFKKNKELFSKKMDMV